MKTKHYTNLETDEERLENRPDNIPLEDFKLLLMYWGDEEVQRKAKTNSAAPTASYISDLSTKIRHEVVDEVEDKLTKKVQDEVDARVNLKVQENLTWVLKKLGEANPGLKIDLAEFCATISSDNEGGTPTTGGPSF